MTNKLQLIPFKTDSQAQVESGASLAQACFGLRVEVSAAGEGTCVQPRSTELRTMGPADHGGFYRSAPAWITGRVRPRQWFGPAGSVKCGRGADTASYLRAVAMLGVEPGAGAAPACWPQCSGGGQGAGFVVQRGATLKASGEALKAPALGSAEPRRSHPRSDKPISWGHRTGVRSRGARTGRRALANRLGSPSERRHESRRSSPKMGRQRLPHRNIRIWRALHDDRRR